MSSAMITTKLGLTLAAGGVGAAEWPQPARQTRRDTAAHTRLAPPGRMDPQYRRTAALGARSAPAEAGARALVLRARLLQLRGLLRSEDRLHLLEGRVVGRTQLRLRRLHGEGGLADRSGVGVVGV